MIHSKCTDIVTLSALQKQANSRLWAFGHTILLGDLGMPKTETLNLRVSADFKKRLMEEAAKERRSVTNYLETTLIALWEGRDATDGKEKGRKK